MKKINERFYRSNGKLHRHTVFDNSRPPSPSNNNWFWKIGLAVVGLYFIGQILEAIAPYLILGGMGWFLLKSKIIKF